MIASIVLKGMYKVGVNSNNKIKIEGHLMPLTDVPFVRYRFSNYGDKEIEFIKNNTKLLKGPVHLVEIPLTSDTAKIIEKMDEISEFEKIAKFVYVPIDDYDIANGFKQETLNNLESIKESYFDRLMLKDNCTMIYPIAADRLKIKIENIFDGEIKSREIGVCGSPLSFRNSDVEGQACLTAVWARKIISEYSELEDDKVTVPTANHECMTCCGCIQYFVVESDIPAPLSSKEKSEKKSSNNSNGANQKPKSAPKPHKVQGVPRFML